MASSPVVAEQQKHLYFKQIAAIARLAGHSTVTIPVTVVAIREPKTGCITRYSQKLKAIHGTPKLEVRPNLKAKCPATGRTWRG